MIKPKKEDLFTLPNILTYFRMLCVPIFAIVFFTKIVINGFESQIYISLGVFIIAEITDILDGKIARKYNLITDIGKILDPLADKLLQMTAIICLTIIGYVPWIFAVILVIKETYMIAGSAFLASKNCIGQANIYGKRAATWLAYGLMASFFHPYLSVEYKDITVFSFDWLVIVIGLIIALYALYDYTKKAYQQLKGKELNKEKINIKY